MKYPTVSESLLDRLAAQDVHHVFLVPGRQIDPLVKSLAHHATVRPVLASHELAAGYMADGYTRASGRVGATFAIGGPGSANLIGAAVTAAADRSPVLFVTGNIPLNAQGRGEFQDAGPHGSNDAQMFRAAIGTSLLCRHAEDLSHTWTEASRQLAARRPVHLSVAMDVQASPAYPGAIGGDVQADEAVPTAEDDALLPPRDWLARGRILLVAGQESLAIAGDIRSAAHIFNLSVATETRARGIVPEDGCHSSGHVGFMPHPRACKALDPGADERADRIVAVGCDAASRVTSACDRRPVEAVSPTVFAAWMQTMPARPGANEMERRGLWLRQLSAVRRAAPREVLPSQPMSYAEVVAAVAANAPLDTLFVVDAGQVRRVACVSLSCRLPRTLLMAEGMAPMGWSLGAAIGAKLACPTRPVVALLGDGAMRMHGIELSTAVRYRLPILYVVFDNGVYGSVLARMGTEAEADTARMPTVDWCAFSRALEVPAIQADDIDALRQALLDVPARCGPRLIVARVRTIEPANPGEATGIDWGARSAH